MFRVPKSVLSLAAGALALGILILTAPRAAHAITAILVQVTNTSANPAITQSAPTQASHLVTLKSTITEIGATGYYYLNPLVNGSVTNSTYTVPANQSLVITDIDITPLCNSGEIAFFLSSNPSGGESTTLVYLQLPTPFSSHLEYRSGLVLPTGTVPGIQLAGCPLGGITIYGYLTAN